MRLINLKVAIYCVKIRQEHTNIEALSLLAFRYFETEDYKMAA